MSSYTQKLSSEIAADRRDIRAAVRETNRFLDWLYERGRYFSGETVADFYVETLSDLRRLRRVRILRRRAAEVRRATKDRRKSA